MKHWDGDPHRRIVIAPGRGYTTDAPLLWYARVAALNAGWSVTDLIWGDVSEVTFTDEQSAAKGIEQVNAAVAAALDEKPATTTILVAKSLGTLAMATAADRGIPGIWLTPLFKADNPWGEYLGLTVRTLPSPQLHVGGTADRSWDRNVVPTEHHVLEVPGADHSLHTPGDALASVNNLLAVTERVMSFMDTCCHGTATA